MILDRIKKIIPGIRILGVNYIDYKRPNVHFRPPPEEKMRLPKLFAICFVAMVLLCGQAAPQVKPKESIDKKLQGHWKSIEAQIEFKVGNRITINGEEYGYSVVGSTIVVGNNEGQLYFPFKFADDVLTVWVENRKVVY